MTWEEISKELFEKRTAKRLDEIDKLNGFELNVLKLLYCIATMRRGHTYEQNIYLQLLENLFFPEED